MPRPPTSPFFFFFNDTATTEIYTLSLHDALPIWEPAHRFGRRRVTALIAAEWGGAAWANSVTVEPVAALSPAAGQVCSAVPPPLSVTPKPRRGSPPPPPPQTRPPPTGTALTRPPPPRTR